MSRPERTKVAALDIKACIHVICKVARKQTDENDELVFAHMTENLQSWTSGGWFCKEQRKCRVQCVRVDTKNSERYLTKSFDVC